MDYQFKDIYFNDIKFDSAKAIKIQLFNVNIFMENIHFSQITNADTLVSTSFISEVQQKSLVSFIADGIYFEGQSDLNKDFRFIFISGAAKI